MNAWWKGERSCLAGLDRLAESLGGEVGSLFGSIRRSFQCRRALRDDGQTSPGERGGPATSTFTSVEGAHCTTPPPPLVPRPSFFLLDRFGPFGGTLVCYVVMALILGVAAINAWIRQSFVDRGVSQIAKIERPGNRGATAVGRITAMADCRWKDHGGAVVNPAAVPLGHTFALESGILEITYKSGVGVILHGPVTYEVDSENSGFLSAGKLTANIQQKGELARRRESRKEVQGPVPRVQVPPIIHHSLPLSLRASSCAPRLPSSPPRAARSALRSEGRKSASCMFFAARPSCAPRPAIRQAPSRACA